MFSRLKTEFDFDDWKIKDKTGRETKRSNENQTAKQIPEVQALFDVLNCFAASNRGAHGIQTHHMVIYTDKSSPIIDCCYYPGDFSLRCPPSISLDSLLIGRTSELYQNLIGLPQDRREELVTAMDCVRLAYGMKESVAQYALARAALESTFTGFKKGSSYQLALRASLLLVNQGPCKLTVFGKRKEIFDKMRKAYQLTSESIHQGRIVPLKGRWKGKEASLLRNSLELAIEAIRLMSDGRINDWKEIELMGGLENKA